jgi:Flp pilus assembly protein TadG
MIKLNQRGTAALEFCLVALPFLLLMFAIFDLGRYAITMQSLRMLASAGARDVMINCYTGKVIHNGSPADCTSYSPLASDTAKQAVAPFLYGAGLAPTLAVAPLAKGATALTVTASLTGFTMIMPMWGTSLNSPSASASIPF